MKSVFNHLLAALCLSDLIFLITNIIICVLGKILSFLKGMFSKNKRIKEKLVTISDVSVKII